MIQRIQSIFLLIVAILIGSLFLNPLMYTPEGGQIEYTDSTTFAIMMVVTLAVSLITIFLFKNRIIQMRLSMINSLILLGFQIWIGVEFFTKAENIAFSITAIFPIIAMILTLFALRAIARDEALVQSISRLRGSRKRGKKK